MRKALFIIGLIATIAGSGDAARAQLTPVPNRIANEPAATLLLPYFEVELPKKIGGKSNGITTIFSLSNASATAVLAHVTLWSDLAVPVTNFNIYLTGYDTLTLNLFDILNGHLPRTASDGQDPTDTNLPGVGRLDGISNQGPISQDINFASCGGQLPYPDPIPVESIDHLRASLSGNPSSLFGGKCAGRKIAEKKATARGYVTIDTVNNCTLQFPDDPTYDFSVTDQNVLFGDYAYLSKSKKIGRGDALVHIASLPTTFAPGDYTFYGRYNGFVAVDARQPLATTFMGRFVNVPKHPVFPTGSSVIAWRDTKFKQVPFTCGTTPFPFPLNQEQIVVFDEQENPEVPVQAPIPPFPASDIMPFTAATQSVKIGGPTFPVATTSGFIYMNLNHTIAAPVPPVDPTAAQAWVNMVLESKGKYSASYRGITLDSASDANHIFIPVF
jgi:hypothetical protein